MQKNKQFEIIRLIVKNPQTSIFGLLLWTLFFIAYIVLHYHGNIDNHDKILSALVISLSMALMTTFFTYLNVVLFKKTVAKVVSEGGPLINWLWEFVGNIEVTSELSGKLFGLFVGMLFNSSLAFLICYIYNSSFRVFIYWLLGFVAFNFIQNVIVTIIMRIKK